jgi:hypothetical protein
MQDLNPMIRVIELGKKVQFLKSIGIDLADKLQRKEPGARGLASAPQSTKKWSDENNKIKKSTAELILNVFENWLHVHYPKAKPYIGLDNLINMNFREFHNHIFGYEKRSESQQEASQDPRYLMSDSELKKYVEMYAGYYLCWMNWINPKDEAGPNSEPRSSTYHFVIRIGEQAVQDSGVSIDQEKSVNYNEKYVKCYMSTLDHWRSWKKDQKTDRYIDQYHEYHWWNGEMVRIVGHVPLLWFRFWSIGHSRGKYVVISAPDEHSPRNIQRYGLNGLLLGQPRLIPDHNLMAQPSCSRVYIKYLDNTFKIDEIVRILDDIKYSDSVEEDVALKIKNDISEFNVLQSHVALRRP